MNKLFFRFLIVLMSLSLIGIILVQVYWFNTSFQNNDEQFRFHVQQVISNVSDKLEKKEALNFYDKYNHFKDSTGKAPQKNDILEFYYVQKNSRSQSRRDRPARHLRLQRARRENSRRLFGGRPQFTACSLCR